MRHYTRQKKSKNWLFLLFLISFSVLFFEITKKLTPISTLLNRVNFILMENDSIFFKSSTLLESFCSISAKRQNFRWIFVKFNFLCSLKQRKFLSL